jgi:hypothetical protein
VHAGVRSEPSPSALLPSACVLWSSARRIHMRAPAPQTFPKWESLKINSRSMSHFLPLKMWPSNHHIHHANHHKFTTKTPRFVTHFLQKPPAKTQKAHAKKIRYILLVNVTDYPEVYGITSVAVAKLS